MSKREGPDTGPEPKRARTEFEKQRLDYYTSWDLFPTGDLYQPWRIEFKGGLRSIFVIDGISSAISGVSLGLLDYDDSEFTFISRDLPQNLTVDVQRVREIESEIGWIGYDWDEREGVLSIGFGRGALLEVYLEPTRNSERGNVHHIELYTDTKDVLSTWWQYAKDDPEEVVNAAASRRQDLLGM